MKELIGEAKTAVAASAEECMTLLAAVDRYPNWYPAAIRGVDVLERDPSGQPTRAQTKLHLAQGPLAKDFDLEMAITVAPRVVRLTRVPHHNADHEVFEVIWHVEGTARTEIRLDLHANLSVPRFLPIGGIGDAVADGFVTAAARALVAEHA